jgi:site-specific DNA-methyltransferase (adenine-specific)
MVWLVGLVAAPGEVVLDPFMGTGTTAIAAMQCRCDWLGYESVRGTFETARRLIEQAEATQPNLFDDIERDP